MYLSSIIVVHTDIHTKILLSNIIHNWQSPLNDSAVAGAYSK